MSRLDDIKWEIYQHEENIKGWYAQMNTNKSLISEADTSNRSMRNQVSRWRQENRGLYAEIQEAKEKIADLVKEGRDIARQTGGGSIESLSRDRDGFRDGGGSYM